MVIVTISDSSVTDVRCGKQTWINGKYWDKLKIFHTVVWALRAEVWFGHWCNVWDEVNSLPEVVTRHCDHTSAVITARRLLLSELCRFACAKTFHHYIVRLLIWTLRQYWHVMNWPFVTRSKRNTIANKWLIYCNELTETASRPVHVCFHGRMSTPVRQKERSVWASVLYRISWSFLSPGFWAFTRT